MLTIVVSISVNGTVFAQATSTTPVNPALDQSKGVYFYKDGVVNKCPADGGATYDAKEIKNIQGMYKSNLAQPYILEQFMIHILKRMSQISGKPESDLVTQEHVLGLVSFAIGEGGDIANRSVFNPMNGGMDPSWIGQSGAVWGGSGADGRRGYATFDVGVELYARQFYTGNQSRIGAVLSDPNSTAQNFMYTLTYFNTYSGNKMWAAASLPPNDKKYYQTRLQLVEQVRKNYPAYAGIVIGTDKFEQKEGIYRKDLITFKSITSSTTNTKPTAGASSPTSSAAEPDLTKITDVKESDKKNIPIIWAWLLGKGFTDVQAAGIMGNMYQESKFEVTLDDPPAYGLIQWQGDRLTRLDSYAKNRGGTRADMNIQLQFMMAELNGGYKATVLDPLKKATTLPDAVNVVLHEYEQPGHYDTEEPLRLKWAKEVFEAMKGVTSAPEPGSTCAPADANPADPTDGSFVFYSQNDKRWGDLSFNGGDIKGDGCGLTSFSMIVATLKKDKSITPKTMQQLVEKEGVTFGTYVGVVLADHFKSRFNLNTKELSASSESQIRDALKSGSFVISGGAYGPYKYKAHIIVLRSIDSNDNVSVADPEMDGLSKKTYKLSEFIGPGKYFVAIKNAQ